MSITNTWGSSSTRTLQYDIQLLSTNSTSFTINFTNPIATFPSLSMRYMAMVSTASYNYQVNEYYSSFTSATMGGVASTKPRNQLLSIGM